MALKLRGDTIVNECGKTLLEMNNEISNLTVLIENISSQVKGNLYPVGSIYMSINSTNPSTIFGGSWEQIKDTFLLACGSTYSAGATGGSATHTLTEAEMPSHTHDIASSGAHTHTFTGWLQTNTNAGTTYQSISHKKIADDGTKTPPSMNSSGAHTHTASAKGSGGAHNNMPPYIAVYVWKRTA